MTCILFVNLLNDGSLQEHFPFTFRKDSLIFRLEPHVHDLRSPKPALGELCLFVPYELLLDAVGGSSLGEELCLAGSFEADEICGCFGWG